MIQCETYEGDMSYKLTKKSKPKVSETQSEFNKNNYSRGN